MNLPDVPMPTCWTVVLALSVFLEQLQAQPDLDQLRLPTQIEITITQEQNGKIVKLDTLIPFETLPNLEQILNGLPLEEFDVNLIPENRVANPPHPIPPAPPQMPYPTRPSMPNRGFLGIYIDEMYDSIGVKISKIQDNSAAQRAGLQIGDLIRAINGIVTNNFDALRYTIDELRSGDTVMVDYERASENRNTEVVLQSAATMQAEKNLTTIPAQRFPLPPNRCGTAPANEWQRTAQQIINADRCRLIQTTGCSATRNALITDLDSHEKKQLRQIGYQKRAKRLIVNALQINFMPELGYLSLSFELPNTEKTTICLLSVAGKPLFIEALPHFGGIYRRGIYLPTLPNEAYYLLINQGKRQYVKRIVLH